jgi:gentisate 1,2-dioxygenase
LHANSQFDLFRYNDGPIIDRLHFTRTYIPQETA